MAARPGLPIWTNKEVAALLEQSGASSAPVHDATLTPAGQQGEDAVFSADPPTGLGTGVPYFRPTPGVPFEF